MRKEIRLKNQVGELEHMAQFIEEIGEELKLDMELRTDLNIVLEELVSNIILYAYPEGAEGTIDLATESDGKIITFFLSDQGREFDPTLKEDPDVETNPAERQLGGMGIFIVKNIMDDVAYQRLEGKNVLTIKKVIMR